MRGSVGVKWPLRLLKAIPSDIDRLDGRAEVTVNKGSDDAAQQPGGDER